MDDLFGREQKIFDDATSKLQRMKNSGEFDIQAYEIIVKEYGRLLKQIRRITKISDRTTIDLNASNLDLLDKVHYDTLTKIYNRRFMEDALKRIIRSLSRSGGTLSVLMIDVDFFKKYNDTYGHQEGDNCLKSVAQTLAGCITRADDFVVRYGGEEFVAILPNTGENGARFVAERMLESVRSLSIPHEKNEPSGCVTVSVGGTSGKVDHKQSGEEYIKRADEAMYISKHSGRNKYTYIKF